MVLILSLEMVIIGNSSFFYKRKLSILQEILISEIKSLSGVVPRLQFDHGSKFDDHKYKYSQGYRIDPLHSLLSLKEGILIYKEWFF